MEDAKGRSGQQNLTYSVGSSARHLLDPRRTRRLDRVRAPSPAHVSAGAARGNPHSGRALRTPVQSRASRERHDKNCPCITRRRVVRRQPPARGVDDACAGNTRHDVGRLHRPVSRTGPHLRAVNETEGDYLVWCVNGRRTRLDSQPAGARRAGGRRHPRGASARALIKEGQGRRRQPRRPCVRSSGWRCGKVRRSATSARWTR